MPWWRYYASKIIPRGEVQTVTGDVKSEILNMYFIFFEYKSTIRNKDDH